MGISASWAAVRAASPDSVLDQLGLVRTGRTEELPESEVVGARLPDGWFLVVSHRDTMKFTSDSVLEQLSKLGELVVCFLEEHVMVSFAACRRGGQRAWQVYHDSGAGIENLQIKG